MIINLRNGYKFPEVYLVPTNFITPEENNNHNSISDLVKMSDLKYILPIDFENHCTYLSSNNAILSPNKRFKMILEESGNLIIKDGTRTMW